ncbi:hypothetical protein GCM10011319_47230 [Mameliella alba]|nr:hypothetical protein GCM10011319_47230 [Mameliella alba]
MAFGDLCRGQGPRHHVKSRVGANPVLQCLFESFNVIHLRRQWRLSKCGLRKCNAEKDKAGQRAADWTHVCISFAWRP